MDSIRDTPNIDYLGPLAQSEVNELLARAHIFVNTSVHEGFPNTFIQAWMREMPVVSLHVNPDDVLNRHGTGIFAGNEPRLAEAVRRLISEPTVRAEFAERARNYALQRHSLENAGLVGQAARNVRRQDSRPMSTLLSINNYYYRRGGAETVFLEHNRMFEAAWLASCALRDEAPEESRHAVVEVLRGRDRIRRALQLCRAARARSEGHLFVRGAAQARRAAR